MTIGSYPRGTSQSWLLFPTLLSLACAPHPPPAPPMPATPAASTPPAPQASLEPASEVEPSAIEPTAPEPTAPEPTAPEPTAPEPTAPPEPTQPEPAAPEPAATIVCDASPVRRQIVQALFTDQAFRSHVCKKPCREQVFEQRVVLRQELLDEISGACACFAEPKRQPTPGLFAVFVVLNGWVRWDMTYRGIHIGTKRGHQTNGLTDLEATERETPTTLLTHQFVFNGRVYVLKNIDGPR